MTIAEDIQQLISAGRFEYSLERSNQYLKNAVELAQWGVGVGRTMVTI